MDDKEEFVEELIENPIPMTHTLREFDIKDVAGIMKYFPEWKLKIREYITRDASDEIEFIINSLQLTEQEAGDILLKFKERMDYFEENPPLIKYKK